MPGLRCLVRHGLPRLGAFVSAFPDESGSVPSRRQLVFAHWVAVAESKTAASFVAIPSTLPSRMVPHGGVDPITAVVTATL